MQFQETKTLITLNTGCLSSAKWPKIERSDALWGLLIVFLFHRRLTAAAIVVAKYPYQINFNFQNIFSWCVCAYILRAPKFCFINLRKRLCETWQHKNAIKQRCWNCTFTLTPEGSWDLILPSLYVFVRNHATFKSEKDTRSWKQLCQAPWLVTFCSLSRFQSGVNPGFIKQSSKTIRTPLTALTSENCRILKSKNAGDFGTSQGLRQKAGGNRRLHESARAPIKNHLGTIGGTSPCEHNWDTSFRKLLPIWYFAKKRRKKQHWRILFVDALFCWLHLV